MSANPGGRAPMPKEGNGWHKVFLPPGCPLYVLFHEDRPITGHENDGIKRPTVVVTAIANSEGEAVIGRSDAEPVTIEQDARFDLFPDEERGTNAHFHVKPLGDLTDEPFPINVRPNESPLDAGFRMMKLVPFRGVLQMAGKTEAALRLTREDLAELVRQIRVIVAAP